MDKKSLILIVLITFFSFSSQSPALAKESEIKEIKNLQEDIRVINLLNSLNLTEQQEAFILNKAKQVKDIKTRNLDEAPLLNEEVVETHKQLKNEFSTGKVAVDEDLAKKFRGHKREIEKNIRTSIKEIDKIALEVENNLEEFQVIALEEYSPCIIPKTSGGRIGQSDGLGHFSKLLERVRVLPQENYDHKKNRFIDRLSERSAERSIPGQEINKNEVKNKPA